MQKLYMIVLSTFLVTGCVAHRQGEPSPARGLGQAIGYLVFSPVMIVAGLFEGIATAPYLIDADLHDMNREMKKANTIVSLDETYQYAYGRRLDTVPKSGSTGRVFRHMSEATGHFQNVLRGYGVADYDRYLLTAVRTADQAGYTLYGVVYRPARQTRILDQNSRVRTVSPGDIRSYYKPYERDASGRPFDVVIDWAGVPRTTIKTQKGQAILMTLAANSVLINRRSDSYWDIVESWIVGVFIRIADERNAQLEQRMGQPGS